MALESTSPYAAVIADLRAKRAKIDSTIRSLEELSGLTLGSDASGFESKAPSNDVGSIEETAGMFLGMSIVEATKKLLALRKKTLGNVEIARELQAGGLVLSGADPVNVIGSVLTRRFNQAGDVVKVGRGIWGLKEWYPGRNFKPAVKASSAPTEIAESSTSYSVQINDLGGAPDEDEDF
jgi:hypothetical protein